MNKYQKQPIKQEDKLCQSFVPSHTGGGVSDKTWVTEWEGNITSGSITIPGISVNDELLVATTLGTFPLYFSGNRAYGFGGTKNTANTSIYIVSIVMDLSGNTLTIVPESTGYSSTGATPQSGTPVITKIMRKQ